MNPRRRHPGFQIEFRVVNRKVWRPLQLGIVKTLGEPLVRFDTRQSPMSSVADVSSPTVWVTVPISSSNWGMCRRSASALSRPGTATEQDVLDLIDHADTICELVGSSDCWEKTMGYMESLLAGGSSNWLTDLCGSTSWGSFLGRTRTLRVLPRQVRIPDACFISWLTISRRQAPEDADPRRHLPIWLSKSFPTATQKPKCGGSLRLFRRRRSSRLVHRSPHRTAAAYTSPEQCTLFDENGVLTGGDVLRDSSCRCEGFPGDGRDFDVEGRPIMAMEVQGVYEYRRHPARSSFTLERTSKDQGDGPREDSRQCQQRCYGLLGWTGPSRCSAQGHRGR